MSSEWQLSRNKVIAVFINPAAGIMPIPVNLFLPAN
jgi:hypothetical protein